MTHSGGVTREGFLEAGPEAVFAEGQELGGAGTPDCAGLGAGLVAGSFLWALGPTWSWHC